MFFGRTFFVSLLVCSVGFIASCGGGGNNEEACSSIVGALFDTCDVNDTADVNAIIAAAAAAGETITAAEIQGATQGEMEAECVQGFEDAGTEVTDAELAAGIAGIDQAAATGDCATVAGVVFSQI